MNIFVIPLLTEGHLGCFQSLTFVSKAAMNMADLESWACGVYAKESYSSVTGYHILRTLHTNFHSNCSSCKYHQRWIRVPCPPSLFQYLILFVLFIFAMMNTVRQKSQSYFDLYFLITRYSGYFRCVSFSTFVNSVLIPGSVFEWVI